MASVRCAAIVFPAGNPVMTYRRSQYNAKSCSCTSKHWCIDRAGNNQSQAESNGDSQNQPESNILGVFLFLSLVHPCLSLVMIAPS